MIKFFNHSRKRVFSSLTLMAFLAQLLAPTVSFALTSGPSQPEFSSFEPVATTDMVNTLSGDFNYNLPVLNVPGPNGGGYALSLSYHSGVGMEEDASWVGYGWTLNPGAINRGKKGFPDDYKKKNITTINKLEANYTISAGPSASVDFFTIAAPSISQSIRYNNYVGYTKSTSYGLGVYGGTASVGYTVGSDGSSSFNYDINPMAFLEKRQKNKAKKFGKMLKEALKTSGGRRDGGDAVRAKINSLTGKGYGAMKAASNANKAGAIFGGATSAFIGAAFGDDQRPLSVSEYTGTLINVRGNIGITPPPIDISFRLGLAGSVNVVNYTDMVTKTASGFLYDDGEYKDYSVEKESNFNKRDNFLPVPFSSPDDFGVTGEGLSGSFRLRKNSASKVAPAPVKSNTQIVNVAVDVNVGTYWGGGGTLGGDFQGLESRDNTGALSFKSSAAGADNSDFEKAYFRFNGDYATSMDYDPGAGFSDAPIKPNFLSYLSSPDDEHAKIYGITEDQDNYDSKSGRVKRSSYVGYHTLREINDQPLLAYELSSDIRDQVIAKKDNNQDEYNKYADLIGEVSSVNEAGNRYIYGLPVFTKNESTMSYGVRDGGNCFNVNKVVYDKISENFRQTGQQSLEPYATTYLLTQITTPEYIDRTFNGPSTDDFGGWTKFKYKKEYGEKSSTGQWYRWRMPYNGLNYAKNSHSDVRDDMGSCASGDKEIYYLEAVETKTHIAKFILDEGLRRDGLDAMASDIGAAENNSKKGSHAQHYLQKIELYAKDPSTNQAVGKPIKTIHFEYSAPTEALCKGIPSSTVDGGGKLTLKKVWFEYEGISKSKISPYEFKYAYKKKATDAESKNFVDFFRPSGRVETDYSKIVNELSNIKQQDVPPRPLDENPNYNANLVDAWGNVAYDGISRNGEMKDWVYQGEKTYEQDTDKAFDPAAWNLKQIVLPSGGQILIQYEAKDYCYVQNMPASALVRLKNGDVQSSEYILDMSDLGISGTDDVAIAAYAELLKAYFDKPSSYSNEDFKDLKTRQVYFKFLFSLLEGDAVERPSVSSCGGEYITGFSKVQDVIYDSDSKEIKLVLKNDGKIVTPQDACRDFYRKNRMMLNLNTDCKDPDVFGQSRLGDATGAVKFFLGSFIDFEKQTQERCKVFTPTNSYLKLPMPDKQAKLGGGIRVKRIMMYDAGFQQDGSDETLYGTEYIYKLEDGRSSGVVGNEPVREENALVFPLKKRSDQTKYQKLTSGDDLDEFEGPYGETLLPNPSVSHARVVTKSIYDGPSSTGFTVSEFYTVKDKDCQTFKFDHSPIDDDRKQRLPLSWVPLFPVDIDNRWAAQGYVFVTNDMHGKPKKTARYGGNYPENYVFVPSQYPKAFEESYEYFAPKEKVPVLNEAGNIVSVNIGREEDITIESKSVEDVTFSATVNFNVGVGFLFVAVLPGFYMSGALGHYEKKLKTVVVNRLIHYPSLLKKTTTEKDGLRYSVENKVFDPMTGDPLITTTSDEYTGLKIDNQDHNQVYTSYEIPAHQVYENFGGAYNNENMEIDLTGLTQVSGSNSKYTVTTGTRTNNFIDGDLVCVYKSGGSAGTSGNGQTPSTAAYAYVSGVNSAGSSIELSMVGSLPASANKLRVLRSGYNNRLKETAGSVVCYGNPIDITAPLSFSGVISASATEYSSNWALSDYLHDHYNISSTDNYYSPYLTGEAGKWRAKSTYVYKAQEGDAENALVNASPKAFSSGTYTNFQKFNYANIAINDFSKWIKGNTVHYYSPNGEPLEESNAVDIHSTAKFGHRENVPLMVASNASFSEILYTGFEDKLALGIVADKIGAHTGNNSMSLSPSQEINADGKLFGYVLSSTSNKKGFLVRWWSKAPALTEASWQLNLYNITATPTQLGITNQSIVKVARVGEWSLYEASMSLPSALATGQKIAVALKNTGTATVRLDDIRVQPSEAQATCYVYDDTSLRLLASFDDRHFALIYQYDAEGKLVRKLVETEKGVKTISETQYNTPKK